MLIYCLWKPSRRLGAAGGNQEIRKRSTQDWTQKTQNASQDPSSQEVTWLCHAACAGLDDKLVDSRTHDSCRGVVPFAVRSLVWPCARVCQARLGVGIVKRLAIFDPCSFISRPASGRDGRLVI